MSNPSAKSSDPEDVWETVTWEGSERAQLRHMKGLTLREKFQAIENMTAVAERLSAARQQARKGSK
jgi:hypothetical protein